MASSRPGGLENGSEQSEQYTYDALGRLKSISVDGGLKETLAYDAEGLLAVRRFAAGASGTETARYYIDKDLTVVQRPAGTLAYAHVIVGTHRVASVYVQALGAAGQAMYYHRDRLGSVVGTSTTGAVAGTVVRYDLYGKTTTGGGTPGPVGTVGDTTVSELGYSGGLNLSAGLVHLQARQYAPGYRKFLQADTVDPLRYTYVRGIRRTSLIQPDAFK